MTKPSLRVCVDAVPLLVPGAGIKNYMYFRIVHLRRACGARVFACFPI